MVVILKRLEPLRDDLAGVVVESTFNWYWLVDGLMEASYAVKLANPAAIKNYAGLKYSGDETDACHLAQLLRLGMNWTSLAVTACSKTRIARHACPPKIGAKVPATTVQCAQSIGHAAAPTFSWGGPAARATVDSPLIA